MAGSCTTLDIDAFDATRQAVEQDPSVGQGSFVTVTTWDDGARARTTARSFTIETDEPAPLGGTDAAVDPMELVLAAVGTCLNIGWVTQARKRRIDYRNLQIEVSGNYDQTKQIASQFAQRRQLLLDRGATSIPAREAMKTIAYEIVEQLGWHAPDWYIQAVSGGLGPLGVYQGFKELFKMGLIDRIPKLAIIQAEGCAPMVNAFKAGKDVAEAVIPETNIIILSTGDPGKAYSYLWNLTQQFGGVMESVTDAEAFAAMRSLAKSEGMAVEPATAVAFAGLEKLIQNGAIQSDEKVVVNCTGHTFPVEKHVLGEQWAVDVHLSKDQSPAPREGLQAALENLDEKTTTVLLIDDNPDDALLIRRLLEGRKAYRVFHAKDGWEGLAMARQKLPDLIVSDLMMPGIDGFGLVEELKLDPRTKDIPIVVVSAKDITWEERTRLNGHIQAVYQKGSLSTRTFVEQVITVIEESNEAQAGRP